MLKYILGIITASSVAIAVAYKISNDAIIKENSELEDKLDQLTEENKQMSKELIKLRIEESPISFNDMSSSDFSLNNDDLFE